MANTTQSKRTVIVTGSARGLGKAIALRLAHDGFDVCVNDIQANAAGVEETVSEIKSLGRNATGLIADVTSLVAVEDMVQKSVAALGPLDVMIANAGIAAFVPLLDLTEQDVAKMFEVNVFGVYNCYAAACRQFIKQGSPGKLIGAASVASFKSFPGLSLYSSSKFAVRGLTQAFAVEMAPHKITATAYAPGIVSTAIWDSVERDMKAANITKEDIFRQYCEGHILLGRLATPQDISNMVSFLAGPESSYLTGQSILVDGGLVMN